MDGLEVRVLSTAALRQIKESLGARGRRAVLSAIANRLKEMTLENFGTEGPFRPESWPPYERDYPKYEKYEGEPATLIREGRMMRSIYVSVTDNYAEVGCDVEYADIHQFGGAVMPPRPYFPIEGTRSGFDLIPQAQSEVERVAYEVFMQEMNK
jgi:phage gpG-like protein